MRFVAQRRRVQLCDLPECVLAAAVSGRDVAPVQIEARLKQMAERGLREERRRGKEAERGVAQTLRFVDASLLKQQHGTVDVYQRRPDMVLFEDEQAPRFVEHVERAGGETLPAEGNRGVREGLRRLVPHAKLVEHGAGLFRHLARVGVQAKFDVDLREIQLTER